MLSWVAGSHDCGPFRAVKNWGVLQEFAEVFAIKGKRLPAIRPQAGEPYTLTVTVNLEQVGMAQLNSLADQFKTALREALKDEALPASLREPLSERQPVRLAFLRSMSEPHWQQQRHRYELWEAGLSFRQIALLERAEERGQPLPREKLPRNVGRTRGEDAVKLSVRRFDAAIHGRSRTGRQVLGQFACPRHPAGACPVRGCDYGEDWLKKFDASEKRARA
jgi:hypothetical protein